MTFNQQILSTLIGSFSGFVLAIVLFYITEKIKNNLKKSNILKCLKLEFQYDINQIDEWLREIDKVLRQVTAMDTMVYSYLKLSNFQTYFLQMAFQTGFLYELINNEDMKNLNNIIYQCSLTNENYVMNNINLWKNQKIAQKEILSMLEYQKDQLHKCKTDLNNIFNKMGP